MQSKVIHNPSHLKTLVIHPNDPTTDFLSAIYRDRDWDVIRENISDAEMTRQIKDHDRIIMMGHGMPPGLLGFGRFVINSTHVYLLRKKETVCIWCDADEFVEKYKLKGFYTGMIISDYQEAFTLSIKATDEEIEDSNTLFAHAVQQTLHLDGDDIIKEMKEWYCDVEGENGVIEYNRKNLYFKK